MLDLLEAVESLKVGIRNGDGVALGRVEQAVGKVAQGIDIYLILAVSAPAEFLVVCVMRALWHEGGRKRDTGAP